MGTVLLVALVWNQGSRSGSKNTGESRIQQKESADADNGLPPLPDPDLARETRREVGIRKSPLFEEKGSQYIPEFLYYLTERGVRVSVRPGLRADVPQAEMRFKKPAADGSLQPVKAVNVAWGPWLNVPMEEGGGDVADWGGTHVNAMGVRVPVMSSKEPEPYLKFGQRYAVRFAVGRDKMYESVIRIPDEIPRGKMYVVDVIAKYPTYTFEVSGSSRKERDYVAGKVRRALPVPRGSLQVQYFNPKTREMRTAAIEANGTFRVRAHDMGGMLRIVEQMRVGVGWIYVRSVDKRELSLPRDADLVVEEEHLIRFDLKIDESNLRDDLRGIALRMHEDDPAPMAWIAFDRVHEHLLNNLFEHKSIQFRFVPGQWYVEALYWPRRTRFDQRERKVIGTVTVQESDAGKTLEVEPLEE